jgi:hypothetical protein
MYVQRNQTAAAEAFSEKWHTHFFIGWMKKFEYSIKFFCVPLEQRATKLLNPTPA